MSASTDGRPPVAIGHVMLMTPDIAKTSDYLIKLGLRKIFVDERVSVLELRGGTHLIVLPSEGPIAAGAEASFDLMVDEIEETRKRYAALGCDPSEIQVGEHHSSFSVVEPGGHRIKVNSSHASDQPI